MGILISVAAGTPAAEGGGVIAVLLFSAGLYLALLLGKALGAARFARAHPAPRPREEFSDVMILQPILGGDPRLAASLATNLEVLRGAHFVWLLDADDRVGWEAAYQARGPGETLRVELVSCPPPPSDENPKLFKLALAEPGVTTRYLVVLDDDTRLSAIGLTAMLDALRDHDVATGLPCYLPGENAPSKFVAQFVNNQSVLTYLPLLVWRPPLTLNGMAYALASARWRELGGFAPLTRRLTDDLAVAGRVRAAGGRIFQSAIPHAISTTVRDWRHHRRIMHRWFVFALLLVRAQPPGWRLAILALHGLPPVLLWGGIAGALARPRWETATVLLGLLVARALVLTNVQRRHFGRSRHAPLASLAAELLQPLHLLHALLSRRIHWRSRVIDVRGDADFSHA